MDTGIEPQLGSPVQIGEPGRDTVEFDLREERFAELTERSLDLPLRFASRVLPDGICTPWWAANPRVGGCNANRCPCERPSAPIRSVRTAAGIPPAPSKNRATPSMENGSSDVVVAWSLDNLEKPPSRVADPGQKTPASTADFSEHRALDSASPHRLSGSVEEPVSGSSGWWCVVGDAAYEPGQGDLGDAEFVSPASLMGPPGRQSDGTTSRDVSVGAVMPLTSCS